MSKTQQPWYVVNYCDSCNTDVNTPLNVFHSNIILSLSSPVHRIEMLSDLHAGFGPAS